MILITGASVYRAGGMERCAVLIDGSTIIEVGEPRAPSGTRVIDGTGCVLGPGLVDLHVHLREPGQTWKEDIASGSAAAVAGGFTAVVAMPNTEPAIDDAKMAGLVRSRGEEAGLLEVATAGCLTRSRQGLEMADLDGMYREGVRIFTDDGDGVADASLLRRILAYLGDLPGAVVAEHAEDVTLSAGGHLNEGVMSSVFGIVGIPALAEDLMVARDLTLAEDTGARIHIQHISTARSAEAVRSAKTAGLAVTAEVTPHHLTLDESALGELDSTFKMYPPLRTADDRQAVSEALLDGTIDAVATDHAPHSATEKDVPFEDAPRGVIGLETAASLTWQALGGDPGLLFDRLSARPARIAGLERQGHPVEPGAPANLVLFDPRQTWVPTGFASRSANSPFLGRELQGRVMVTIHDGELVHGGVDR